MKQIYTTKVVDVIRKYYPDAIIKTGIVELQDTSTKRIQSWKKGYTKGQSDLMIINFHKDYSGLCIEFKSPTNKYQVSDAQKEIKKRYKENCYYFILSNDYDHIAKEIYAYMAGVRLTNFPLWWARFCTSYLYLIQILI